MKKNYMENGDMFWLAVDDRVIGSVGYRSIDGTDEVWLHRLFVKYNHKQACRIKNVFWNSLQTKQMMGKYDENEFSYML